MLSDIFMIDERFQKWSEVYGLNIWQTTEFSFKLSSFYGTIPNACHLIVTFCGCSKPSRSLSVKVNWIASYTEGNNAENRIDDFALQRSYRSTVLYAYHGSHLILSDTFEVVFFGRGITCRTRHGSARGQLPPTTTAPVINYLRSLTWGASFTSFKVVLFRVSYSSLST